MTNLTEKEIEDLRLLANADLPCSPYAQKLLFHFEGETTFEPTKPPEPDTPSASSSQNQTEGSVFAF